MAFILETTQNAMNPRQPRERSTPANVASIVRCASHAHLTSKAPRRHCTREVVDDPNDRSPGKGLVSVGDRRVLLRRQSVRLRLAPSLPKAIVAVGLLEPVMSRRETRLSRAAM
jgi:hypothetical protein